MKTLKTIFNLAKYFVVFALMLILMLGGAYFFIWSIILSFKYIAIFLLASVAFGMGAFMLNTVVDSLNK
tara:strand:- start:53 stop:259 length:207 start_codon:yes stop_codon:yes gene_type:complete